MTQPVADHAVTLPEEQAAEPTTARRKRRTDLELMLARREHLAARVPVAALVAATGLSAPSVRLGLARLGIEPARSAQGCSVERVRALECLAIENGQVEGFAAYVSAFEVVKTNRSGGPPVDPSGWHHAPEVPPAAVRGGASAKTAKLDQRRRGILDRAHAELGQPDLSATLAAIWPRDPNDPAKLIAGPERPFAGGPANHIAVAGPVVGSAAVVLRPVAGQVRGVIDLWAAARGW